MSYGSASFGSSPYGGENTIFQLVGARATNSRTVRLTFTEQPDSTDSATLNPLNYVIQKVVGGLLLTTQRVVVDPDDPLSLQVFTLENYEYARYQVTVDLSVVSVTGQSIDSDYRSALYSGFVAQGILQAQALRAEAIVVLFGQEMIADAELITSSNYVVADAGGNLIPVVGVTPNLLVNPTRVTLELGSPLVFPRFYTLAVSDQVLSTQGLTVLPATSAVKPYNPNRLARIPLSKFTGEVHSDLFGNPEGLMFFSPSLIPSGAPNSSLQVDEVSVRTRAYDQYVFPDQPEAPNTLYTYGLGTDTRLNQNALFAKFGRQSQVKMRVSDLREDILAAPTDAPPSQTIIERYNPDLIALLNNPGFLTFKSPLPSVGDYIAADDHVSPAWVEFDASPQNVAHPFITANNTTLRLAGEAFMPGVELTGTFSVSGDLDGGSTVGAHLDGGAP